MRNNDKTNNLIKWFIIIGDFVILNVLMYVMLQCWQYTNSWGWNDIRIFVLTGNLALGISECWFHNIIYQRHVTAGDIVRRVVLLTITYVLIAYGMMKLLHLHLPIVLPLFLQGSALFLLMLFFRYTGRQIIKIYRQKGSNTRLITFVGSDVALLELYNTLVQDGTMGYKLLGYYADSDIKNAPKEMVRIGSITEILQNLDNPDKLQIGDELYVSLSRKDHKDTIRKLSRFCDQNVRHFFYVPVSVETLRINLRREQRGEMEVYTTYESPLANPINRSIKRTIDIIVSLVALLFTSLIYPFVWLLIKKQSSGPIFFTQNRTGLDGKTFSCFKFRSMHVNKDADTLQATKDDPRKFPFGNFMRKTNIDELPQFWNVLKGDMSIVGPRPHMLAHTEMYSSLIDKYMVRHFVKPGVTGWAQVTGFRGETKELWQMEGRVQRDIWYIENWSIWLDIRIIWMTVKQIFIKDEHAY